VAIRLTAIAGLACALFLTQASITDTAYGQAQPKPKPVPKAPGATQWWCEVSAQPASGVVLTQEERDHTFFISQIITVAHPIRTTEEEIQRRCRTSFQVQFGTRFDVITARVYFAATPDEADNDRHLDMSIGVRRNHTRDFRMPQP
jgi:hypothetical protein